MVLNELSGSIIQFAIKIHSELGPGMLESVYQRCLCYELQNSGLAVESEKFISINYCGEIICDDAFRLDLLVENQIIVELKSVQNVRPVHKKQLLTYLRLADKPLGLLINFNENLLKDGITRVVNNL